MKYMMKRNEMTCNMHTQKEEGDQSATLFRTRARSRFLRENGFDGDDFGWDAGLVGTTKVFSSFVFVLLAPKVVCVVFFPPLFFDEREKKAL